MAVTIDVGKIKLTWQGTWGTTTTYEPDDLVYYTVNNDTSSYIAISTSTNQAPKSATGVVTETYWNTVAVGSSFAFKGSYDASTAYVVNDVVEHDDSVTTSAYINKLNSTGEVPSTAGTVNSTYWSLMVRGASASSGGTANDQVQLKSGTGFAGTSDFSFASGIATIANSGNNPIVLDTANTKLTVNGTSDVVLDAANGKVTVGGNDLLDDAAGLAIALG